MGNRDEIVVGLDIGTTKMCCIVGEKSESGIDIIGIGTAPSQGLRKGVVVNIESTVASIRQAVEEAEPGEDRRPGRAGDGPGRHGQGGA